MTCKEAEKIGRAMGYPGYSSAGHSLASNTEKTGVMGVPALWDVFGYQPSVEILKACAKRYKAVKEPAKDYHTKEYRLSVRVTEERYNLVKRLIAEDGRFPTINSFLDWWLYVFIEQKMKKAPAVGAAETERGCNPSVTCGDSSPYTGEPI